MPSHTHWEQPSNTTRHQHSLMVIVCIQWCKTSLVGVRAASPEMQREEEDSTESGKKADHEKKRKKGKERAGVSAVWKVGAQREEQEKNEEQEEVHQLLPSLKKKEKCIRRNKHN